MDPPVIPGGDEIRHDGERPIWRLTSHVRRVLDAHAGATRLLLVLSAESCHGCDVLAGQLLAHGAALGDEPVLKAVGGDFLAGDFVRDVEIGRLTLSTPGVPLAVLFHVASPTRLAFRSMCLGPLPERDPAKGLEDLLGGRSLWAEEAAGARIRACVGPVCFFLDAGNAFSAPFSAVLPDAPA